MAPTTADSDATMIASPAHSVLPLASHWDATMISVSTAIDMVGGVAPGVVVARWINGWMDG